MSRNDRRPRLTTRSRETAQHIADRKPFTTSGSMSAQSVDGLSAWDSGYLSGTDLDTFRAQCRAIIYVVYSYSTPIAWYWGEGAREGWHFVDQKFSSTTSKHQGNLYLAKADVEAAAQHAATV